MRIVFLNHNIVNRSTYIRCFVFAQELVSRGHQVTLITTSEKNKILFHKYSKSGVTIIESPDLLFGKYRSGWDLISAIRRYWQIRNQDFDLIHAFDCRPTVIIPALLYKYLKHKPLIIDWADWWGRGGAITLRTSFLTRVILSPLETFFEEFFRKFADYSTVISDSLKKRAIKLGIKSKSITIIPNGADTSNLRPLNKLNCRKVIGLSLGKKYCIYPSYVLYDVDFVLESFYRAYKKDNNLRLLLLGKYFENQIKKYFPLLKNKIILISSIPRDKINIYLSAADVGLLPLSNNIANSARIPVKFGDYLAVQLPFITTNVGNVGRLTLRGNLGVIAKYNADSYAGEIIKLINNQKDRQLYRQNMKKFTSMLFSASRQVTVLEKIYEQISF